MLNSLLSCDPRAAFGKPVYQLAVGRFVLQVRTARFGQ